MEITVNPAELTKDEREAVAGFILTFPGAGQMEKQEKAQGSPLTDAFAGMFQKPEAGKPELIQDPAAAFTPSAPPLPPAINSIPQAPVSTVGPMLVIPNPEPATPAPPATGAVLDKQGLPWDVRIHSAAKTFNADGTWRRKRWVETTMIQTVEAELKNLMAIPSPAAAPAPVVPPPPGSTVAASPVAPPPPPPAGTSEAELRMQFVALVGRASAAIQNGKLMDHELNSTCAFAGVGSLPLLGNRLDLVPQVAAAIDQIIASRP